METEIYEIKGIPNEDVPDVVADLQADPRYISHMVIPEGGGTSMIIAVFSKHMPPASTSLATMTVRRAKKRVAKKKRKTT